ADSNPDAQASNFPSASPTGYTTDRQRSPSADIDLITIDSFQCIHHNFGHYLAQLLSFPLMQWKNMM
ncbi:hypothetical protein, partial [Bifidobacterium longum]|uniref:hypothetical protein n=1 Tax=Bifidobacterium longum TaxID=216816 RepID=UPI001C9DB789